MPISTAEFLGCEWKAERRDSYKQKAILLSYTFLSIYIILIQVLQDKDYLLISVCNVHTSNEVLCLARSPASPIRQIMNPTCFMFLTHLDFLVLAFLTAGPLRKGMTLFMTDNMYAVGG